MIFQGDNILISSDYIAELEKEIEVCKKALELMAETIFDSECDHKYPECTDLCIYMHPCQKCIDCIVNDYLQESRKEVDRLEKERETK